MSTKSSKYLQEPEPINYPEIIKSCVDMTNSDNPVIRKEFLKEMCPCHTNHDIEEFWNKILSMVHDPDPKVRYQVLHALCDGSPKNRETEIIDAIASFHNDPDPKLRKQARRIMVHYRKTGKWNIL